MAIKGPQIEARNILNTQSKLKVSDWKKRITDRVERNDEEAKRFKADPSLNPARYRRHNAVKELRSELHLMTDPLTGLANKKYFEEEERRETGIVNRDTTAPSVEGILMDIDNFGAFNKDLGNTAGDEVLRKVGATILSAIRDTDIAGRVGGEELAIMSRRTNNPSKDLDREEVPLPAERVRLAIQNIELDTGRKVTVSVGVTQYRRGEEFETYQARKEAAQIVAKRLGKNRVVEGLIIGSHEVFKDWSNNKFYKTTRGPKNEILDIIEVPNG